VGGLLALRTEKFVLYGIERLLATLAGKPI
jgi:hypothetical protein